MSKDRALPWEWAACASSIVIDTRAPHDHRRAWERIVASRLRLKRSSAAPSTAHSEARDHQVRPDETDSRRFSLESISLECLSGRYAANREEDLQSPEPAAPH